MNRRIIVSFAMLIAVTASARVVPAQSSPEREFVGTINKTLRVRILLSRSGKNLNGSYAYERVGTSLRLNGEMMSETRFDLEEFDERGNQTGKFDGAFVSKDWIEGTCRSANGKKEMPFSAWVIDGQQIPATDAHDRVSGRYRRVDDRGRFDPNSSELNVWLLKDGRIRVAGVSQWVTNAKTGNVNFGEVDGVLALQGRKLFYKRGDEDDECRLTITLGADSLTITDDNLQCGGLNVNFDGKYQKVGHPKSN